MDECEESEQENCGRFTFREADLAYLLVDEERMFPLAELLASLFSNTARTTLFTRMEKINTRRHFCSAEEIKLLKTVNGIHGSSAICTLIPEADVEKYCAVYIDRTLELKLLTKGKRTRKESAKTKDSNWIKGGVTEDSNLTAEANANEEKTATNSNVGNDKVNRAINSSKRKNQPSSNKQKMNDDGAKAKVSWEGQDSLSLSNHSQLLGECSEIREDPNSSATLAEPDVTNGSILTLSSEHAVKARKKRKAKDCLEGANFTKDNFGQNKRSKNKDEADNIHEDNVQFKNQEATCGKKIGKKKEKRPNSISDKDKVGVESKRNVVKKRRKRKPQKDKSESVEGSGVINIVDSSTKKSNLSKTPGTIKHFLLHSVLYSIPC
ncbi:hypothetical protein QZH41_003657 [Actinostola sp. cb2023]|nr:hypothetical protein QZH41_003657 [Actinostola sp. cb2023]